jgi:hypothetical protein
MLERSLAGLLGMLFLTTPAFAQATADQAKLVFTVGLGYSGSTDLWSVDGQPLLRPAGGVGSDTVSIDRDAGGSLGVLFSGIYFPKDAIGIAGEAFFLGIGVQDQCAVTSAAPSDTIVAACTDIDGHEVVLAVLLTVGRFPGVSSTVRHISGSRWGAVQQPQHDTNGRRNPGGQIIPVYDDDRARDNRGPRAGSRCHRCSRQGLSAPNGGAR